MARNAEAKAFAEGLTAGWHLAELHAAAEGPLPGEYTKTPNENAHYTLLLAELGLAASAIHADAHGDPRGLQGWGHRVL